MWIVTLVLAMFAAAYMEAFEVCPSMQHSLLCNNETFTSGQATVRYVRLANSRKVIVKTFKRYTDYRNELAVLSELHDCPNVLQPTCLIPELYEIAFPVAENGDLYYDAFEGLTFSNIKDILKQLVMAVDSVHRTGYLHLDIKPENIVRHGNTAYLIDFGLASPIKNSPRRVGTPRTMAPECLIASSAWMPISEASDWWSVGVTMYYILSKYLKAEDDSHFHYFPYRVLYDDDGVARKHEWPLHPPKKLPSDFFDLLFGEFGLLSYDYLVRRQDAKDILSHPFFTNQDFSI